MHRSCEKPMLLLTCKTLTVMKPSIFLPPSTFYTRLLPYCDTVFKCNVVLSNLLEYDSVIREFLPLFFYGRGNVEDVEFAKVLQNEQLAISIYIQEVEERLTELELK